MSCKPAAAAAPIIRASALWQGAATVTGFMNRHNYRPSKVRRGTRMLLFACYRRWRGHGGASASASASASACRWVCPLPVSGVVFAPGAGQGQDTRYERPCTYLVTLRSL
jgi:hypothetical protein